MADRKLVENILAWFTQNARDLPWRRTRDPYAIWVSEIMLQQTQVKTVLPYWERWMRTLPTIQALGEASPDTLHKLWEGLGYYTRVRNMQRAADIIVHRHGGRFPVFYEDILELPGIGRYTAGAICSIAFNQPKPVLDGNVIRVLTRVFGITGDPRSTPVNQRLWGLAEGLIQCAGDVGQRVDGEKSNLKLPGAKSSAYASTAQPCCSHLNQGLMELGALLCTPQQPNCAICPLQSICVAFRNGKVNELPNLCPRVRPTPRRFVAFLVTNRQRVLVRQRPAGIVNGHLWELPNVEIFSGDGELHRAARRALGFRPAKLEALGSLKHSITRFRITVDVFRATPRGRARAKPSFGRWLSAEQLKQLAFTSAHRKLLQRFAKPH